MKTLFSLLLLASSVAWAAPSRPAPRPPPNPVPQPLQPPQQLVNRDGGLCLTVGVRGREQVLSLQACHDGAEQQWLLLRGGELQSVLTNACLTPGSGRNRKELVLEACGRGAQAWQVAGRGGFFALRNAQTGQCIEGSDDRGDRPELKSCERDSEQMWSWATPARRPLGKPLVSDEGLCLAPGARAGDAARLVACTGALDEAWVLNARGELVNERTGECLDPASNSGAQGRKVSVGRCTGATDERWNVVAYGARVAVVNQARGMCLDIKKDERGSARLWPCDARGVTTWTWGRALPPPPPRPAPPMPPPPAPRPPPPAPPMPPPAPHRPPPAPQAMLNASFEKVLDAMRRSSFSSDKLQAFEIGTANEFLTAGQLARAVQLVSLSSDKLRVVEFAAPRILDPENREDVVRLFSLSSDQQKARSLLAGTGVGRPPVGGRVAPMPQAHFEKVLDGMRRSSFAKDKQHAFEVGTANEFLTCAQLARAVELVPSGRDKVELVRLAAPRILDRENREDVVRLIPLSSDQRTVRELLR